MPAPKLGLNCSTRDPSTRRRMISNISMGIRISGFTIPKRSSESYRGISGSLSGMERCFVSSSVATHLRAFCIASNLCYIRSCYKRKEEFDRRIILIDCQLISETGHRSMHFCASQRFRISYFSSSHLN
jgi:hypothetical protein